MAVSVTYLKLAKLMFAGLMLAFVFSVGDANLVSAVDAKTFNLDDCTKSKCDKHKKMAAEATDHFYQSCNIDGAGSKKPKSMECHVKNIGGKWDACEPAANAGDQMWCSCTNANVTSKSAKIVVKCDTDS